MKRRLLLLGAGVALALVLAVGLLWRPAPPPVAPPSNLAQRSELDLRGGILYRHGAAEPFSGKLVEYYAPGKRKLELEIRAGRIDGLARGWHENGNPEVEEHFTAGTSQGLRTRWHENGQKKSEEQIVQGLQEGLYMEWHDNGARAVEMTMLHGQAEGLVQAWYPNGELKSRTKLHDGRVVDRHFFPAPLAATAASQPASHP